MSNLNNLISEFAKQKKEFSDRAGKLLVDELRGIPGVEEIRWAQYTPYFNDGDSCEFIVGDIYFRLENSPEDAGDYRDGFQHTYDIKKVLGEKNETYIKLKEINEMLGRPEMQSILQSLYDDHVEVTINVKTGEATTSSYSHD